MTDQKVAGLEKLAALGTHTAFSLQILLRLCRKKTNSHVAKVKLKALLSFPSLL